MTGPERWTRERAGRGEVGAGGSSRIGLAVPWVAVGVLAIIAAGVWWGFFSLTAGHHPDPRPDLSAETVLPAARYAEYARVGAVYAQAAEIPSVLDGLYCYCDCSRHSGHRSLFSCFESDHGAACDICLSEAALAYRMTKTGRSLEEIRDAIDELYGG